jgi:UrcA family protein
MKSQILAALAATCLLAPMTALAAPAGPGENAPTAAVRYDDLNLNTPDGHATLMSRVRHAAQKICGPADSVDKFADAQRVRSCVNKTQAEIMAKLPAAAQVAGSSHSG